MGCYEPLLLLLGGVCRGRQGPGGAVTRAVVLGRGVTSLRACADGRAHGLQRARSWGKAARQI